ncbi:MAG TPA: DUF1573 domain-containing protein [candidate division Zixibacteria bacterium]|nr:DUF1573 domain-containing protein [candidate division Zixibacteria bacterium]
MRLRHLLPMLLVLTLAAAVSAGPVLSVSEQDFNFGQAPQNAKISHIFWLRNTGDDTLRIINVKPGCGCTQAPLDKKLISPGDSACLEIIFSTKSYKGRVVKSPTIMTNEGGQPHRVRIHAVIQEQPNQSYPLILSPSAMDLVDLPGADQGKYRINFSNQSDQPLHFKMIDIPADLVAIDLPKELAVGANTDVTLEMTSVGQTKAFLKSLTFELDDPDTTRVTLPLKYQPHVNAER